MLLLHLADIVAVAEEVSPPAYRKPDHVELLRILQRNSPTPDEPERPVSDYAGGLFADLARCTEFDDPGAVARHAAALLLEHNGQVVDPEHADLISLAEDVVRGRASAFRAAAVLRELAEGA